MIFVLLEKLMELQEIVLSLFPHKPTDVTASDVERPYSTVVIYPKVLRNK